MLFRSIAKHLKSHPDVAWVNYPGLEDDAYHAKAVKILDQGKGFGGILSFGVKGGRDQGRKFIEALELFTHLANIGDSRSLAIHNASTTHSQLNDEELATAGVSADMVRLSVGIENVDDLIADIDQALAASK